MGKYRDGACHRTGGGRHPSRELSVQAEASRRLTVGLLLAFVLLFSVDATSSPRPRFCVAGSRRRQRGLADTIEGARPANLALEESIAERKRSEEFTFRRRGVFSGAGRSFFPRWCNVSPRVWGRLRLMGELVPTTRNVRIDCRLRERKCTISIRPSTRPARTWSASNYASTGANSAAVSRDAMLAEMGVKPTRACPCSNRAEHRWDCWRCFPPSPCSSRRWSADVADSAGCRGTGALAEVLKE